MFWKRRQEVPAEQRSRLRAEGWSACLDTVEEFLGQHAWVTDEEDRREIFCDACGASLSRKLKSMRKRGLAER